MTLLPIPNLIKQQTQKKMRKEKKKTAPPLSNPKSPEVKYRRQLNQLVSLLTSAFNTEIAPLLKQLESQYVADGYATTLEDAFNNMRRAFNNIGTQAKIVSNAFVEDTNNANKDRFYKAMNKAIGINIQTIVQDEGLSDILTATTRSNVGLITSIPDEYFKQIETIVFDGVTRGNKASSMLKQIQKVGRTTQKRAKLIARDQTSKLNAALTQQRQINLGVDEYIWRTADDGRVRDSHRAHNGKTFRWDKPPTDTGHPGQDIQCRCVAQAIINL